MAKTSHTKPNAVQLAEEISDLTSWIESAKEELKEYGDRDLNVRIRQRYGTFDCHRISPEYLPQDRKHEISEFMKHTIRKEIRRKQDQRTKLIKQMKTPR